MSRPQNRLKLDGRLHDIEAGDETGITKFWVLVEGIGAGGADEVIQCVAFGRAASHLRNDLDVLDIEDTVRVTGGLRIEGGAAAVLADSVRPIYHRDDES